MKPGRKETLVTRAVEGCAVACLLVGLDGFTGAQEAARTPDQAQANATPAESGTAKGAPSIPSADVRKKTLREIADKQAAQVVPETPEEGLQDVDTRKKYLAALQKYYEYRIDGYGHRLRVFEWQLVSTKVIFFVVLMLVFAGLYFAALQFKRGLKQGEKTEFTASLKGITVSSPVLGVIILVISFAFFYLYLVYVYPIVDVF